MKSLSATDAARRFSDVLDAVENDGESFVVVRRGRPVARIEPAGQHSGRGLKDLLHAAHPDEGWLEDIRAAREATLLEERHWPA